MSFDVSDYPTSAMKVDHCRLDFLGRVAVDPDVYLTRQRLIFDTSQLGALAEPIAEAVKDLASLLGRHLFPTRRILLGDSIQESSGLRVQWHGIFAFRSMDALACRL